jgi:thiamine-phosphate pyrophosphorylase
LSFLGLGSRGGGGAPLTEWVLQLVTDPLEVRLPLAEAVAAAVRGGVDAVQVREKGAPAADVLRLVRAVQTAVGHGALVLVNDRVDVALAAEADGVHLAARSLPPGEARRLLPRSQGWLLGVSVHSVEEARAAAAAGVDYVTFGHVFPTGSKPGVPSRGLAALAEVVDAVAVPVLAIGGIGPTNVAQVLATGCAGVAVIRALLGSADPEAEARALRAAMEAAPGRPRVALRRPGPAAARAQPGGQP